MQMDHIILCSGKRARIVLTRVVPIAPGILLRQPAFLMHRYPWGDDDHDDGDDDGDDDDNVVMMIMTDYL